MSFSVLSMSGQADRISIVRFHPSNGLLILKNKRKEKRNSNNLSAIKQKARVNVTCSRVTIVISAWAGQNNAHGLLPGSSVSLRGLIVLTFLFCKDLL